MVSRYESIDTNILLRMMINDNRAQRKKVVELLLGGPTFYVDKVVIIEAVYVMTKEGYARDEIIDKLEAFLDNIMIRYDVEFFETVFRDYVTHPSLSFEDLVIAKQVEENGMEPLWTFDRKFANQSEVAKLLD